MAGFFFNFKENVSISEIIFISLIQQDQPAYKIP